MRNSILILLLVIQTICRAADSYPRNEAIDILHYQFRLELNDSTDRIGGETAIDIRFKKVINNFELDLVNVNPKGQGMIVSAVLLDGKPLEFSHKNDRLKIMLPAVTTIGAESKFVIRYSGIPQDGLIISKNKFGDRTFFGDNWPNRAHHWLPTIDHPYEKASCEFIITAPEQYSVIGTGVKLEESATGKKMKTTHWKTSVALPTKVMVIGVARFATKYEGIVNGVSLESWVYPQNRLEGFSAYAIAAGPLNFFNKMIAPYPYEKLANVQSTTRYGGMENAGNIFYFENSVGGKQDIETLVAHEVAHQWFGDSASEADWYHVWLSEGFATYGAHLYLESIYGSKRLAEDMEQDKNAIKEYNIKNPSAIVNTSVTDLTKILNTNSYEKGSWVLHMLRHEIGDDKFWQGIREYYEQYQFGNAITDDFRKVMEKVSGRDLKLFFDQWIFKAGQPGLGVTWSYDSKKKLLNLEVEQRTSVFDFPLEIGITNTAGMEKIEKIHISAQKQHFQLPVDNISKLRLDPGNWLLYSADLKEIRK